MPRTYRISPLQDKAGLEVHLGSSNSGSEGLRIPCDGTLNADKHISLEKPIACLVSFFFFFLCGKLQAERASHFSAVIWLVCSYWGFPVGQEKSRNHLVQQDSQRWEAHLHACPTSPVLGFFHSLLSLCNEGILLWTLWAASGVLFKDSRQWKGRKGLLGKYWTLLIRGKHLFPAWLCLV